MSSSLSLPVRLSVTLLKLVQALPFRALSAVGVALGWLLYWLPTDRKRVGRINLARCLPQFTVAERETLLRRHFIALLQMLLEYGYCWFASRERIEQLMHIEGMEHLQRLQGRPVILSMPHFTGLDLAGLRLSFEVPVVSMYSPQKDPQLDALFKQNRLRFGTGQVFSRRSGVRPALRALREGHCFYYLPDQDHGAKDAVFASFFGQPAATITALSRIAGLTGAAVLPCYPRRGRDRYTLVIEPALENFPGGSPEADARRINEVIERQVLRQAHQYFWLHKRFKTRPMGAAPVY